MTSDDDARVWLRANGYVRLAEVIDSMIRKWAKRGVKTRRNWWEVLGGNEDGRPRTVDGFTFPVLAAARRRQGLPESPIATELHAGESAPGPTRQGRWGPKGKAARQSPGQTKAFARPQSVARDARRNAKPRHASAMELVVRNFAQLEHVRVPLRDLVVLVGPQATGKSLVLELLKLAVDRSSIVRSMKQHGFTWDSPSEFASLYFGGGFDKSWSQGTEVNFLGQSLTLEEVSRARGQKREEAVFYVPAHRTLAIAEGWPRPFTQYQVETPYVARKFSEELLTSLNQGLVGKGKIFPHDRRLKDAFRKLIDDAVFHGATLRLDTAGMRKQFVLEYGREARLPYMAWTAGQREFTPLLLGLYHLLPAGGTPKKGEIQWAVLEEPEMGLHPKAVVAVMAVVLDLLARGYKVALSTHSPTVLEVVWGMSQLKARKDGAVRLCDMMGLPSGHKDVQKTAASALARTFSVVHVQHENGRVVSKDITNLDPGASDPREWGWGGLTGFSAVVSEVIASKPGEKKRERRKKSEKR